ncbi:MAG: TetR/AcrR family transcriptional regulator [Coprobacillus sp.]|nr:TetR/AcrR family transcriptional regulator [Coprobacillus sp.]
MPSSLSEEEISEAYKKIYALYSLYGCNGISMDKVSQETGISKATLYSYFDSKESIVTNMVSYLISCLDSVELERVNSIDEVISCIEDFYTKSVMIAALSRGNFLHDVKEKFPEAYESAISAMKDLEKRFESFYNLASSRGYVKKLYLPLVTSQFRSSLPLTVDVEFQKAHHLTLTSALKEYYIIFLSEIIDTPYIHILEKSSIYDFIPHLKEVLINDFYITTVRRSGGQ